VARDRQRAKQRRRRQTGGGAGPTRPGRQRPREPDAEPDVEPDVEPEIVEPEPSMAEPTDTVFPTRRTVEPVEADEPLDFDETVEPAADELDPAVTEEREERVARQAGRRRSRGRIITFLGHVVDELRRVQWPDRQHVAQGTAVTLGFVVVAGTFLGLMDAIWKPLIEAIL
jgi:preprotein translocase SecE subunit